MLHTIGLLIDVQPGAAPRHACSGAPVLLRWRVCQMPMPCVDDELLVMLQSFAAAHGCQRAYGSYDGLAADTEVCQLAKLPTYRLCLHQWTAGQSCQPWPGAHGHHVLHVKPFCGSCLRAHNSRVLLRAACLLFVGRRVP